MFWGETEKSVSLFFVFTGAKLNKFQQNKSKCLLFYTEQYEHYI